MKILSKSLALNCILFLVVGTAGRLSAQTVRQPTFPRTIRTYVGTVTQTSAAGAVTTGTFELDLKTQGTLYAQTVIDGTTVSYYGLVSRASLGERRTSGSGYIQFLPLPISATPGSTDTVALGLAGKVLTVNVPTEGTITPLDLPKIPVVINRTAAYGGILNADGSSLVFRGARPETTLQDN